MERNESFFSTRRIWPIGMAQSILFFPSRPVLETVLCTTDTREGLTFWDVTPCSMVVYWRFGGTSCLRNAVELQTTWYSIPEDSHTNDNLNSKKTRPFTGQVHTETEQTGATVKALNLYAGSVRLKFRLGHWLSWVAFFVNLHSPSKQLAIQYLD